MPGCESGGFCGQLSMEYMGVDVLKIREEEDRKGLLLRH
jgi:hypothetical protein